MLPSSEDYKLTPAYTTGANPMTYRVLILTPAVSFSEQLRDALLRRVQDLTVDVAGNTAAALPVIAEADALLTIGSALTDEILAAASRLKWIQSLGTGVDGIVDRPTLRREVRVTNARGLFDDSVSECALALMLALARDLPRIVRNRDARRWEFWIPTLLSSKRVGIVGLGAIGSALARKCKALGMSVVGISNRRSASDCDEIHSYEQLAEIARELDFLVLAAALTSQNRGLIDHRVLAAIRRGSYLVNVARGAMVVEHDLIEALRSGTLAGAALDAFMHEPLPKESPLWSCPNLMISPHLAGPNDTHLGRVLGIIEPNIRAMRRDQPEALINIVV